LCPIHKKVENDICLITLSGELTADEINHLLQSIEESKENMPILYDFSTAAFRKLSSEFLEKLIQKLENILKTREKIKVALVSSTQFNFGYLRMFETRMESKHILTDYHTFKNRQDALDWLKKAD